MYIYFHKLLLYQQNFFFFLAGRCNFGFSSAKIIGVKDIFDFCQYLLFLMVTILEEKINVCSLVFQDFESEECEKEQH